MRKLLFLLPLVAGFVACSNENLAGGPGSITTNGRAESDGAGVPYARVSLREVDHKAISSGELAYGETDFYTDSLGQFKLKIPKEGEFRLTVYGNGTAFTKVVDADSKGSLDKVDLVPTAVMQGELDIPEGSNSVWVGVLGTDILVPVDANGVFVVPALPAKDSLQLYFVNEAQDSVMETKSLFLMPTEFVYENYKSFKDVPRDTTVSGDTVEVPVDSAKKVLVLMDDDSPAVYATVALRPDDYAVEKFALHNSLVKADLRTDTDGLFSMEWPDSGSFRLTVVAGNYSFSEVFDANSLSEIDTLRLEASSSISSKVTLKDGESYAWVGAYGLDILVKTDDQGAYALPAVPAGKTLDLYFVHADSTEPFVEWTVKAPKEGAGSLSPEKLLYDFEEDSPRWYLSVDTLWKGSTYKFESGKADSEHLLKNHLEMDESRNSLVFHSKYAVANDPYAWVLVGTGMDEVRNFSIIDSIGFYAKGSGNVRLTLENWESYSKGAKAGSSWIALDSTWKEYIFKPSDLCYTSTEVWNCEKSWDAVKNQVRQIHIFPNGGSEIYIDDVKLYGALF